MALSDDQVRELARRFAAVEMDGWDDAAFGRAREALGWRVPEHSEKEPQARRETRRRRVKKEEYDTGFETDPGTFERHGARDERSQIQVRAGEGDELFRRLRAALEAELGGPSILRGPGPLLRWRGTVRLLELEKIMDGVYLRIRPAEVVENSEYRTAQWGDAEYGTAELGSWQVVGRRRDETDLFIPGGYLADGWAQFEEMLARTLGAVVRDFALLGDLDAFIVVVPTPEDRKFVQWWASEATLEIEAAIPDGADAAWSAAMAELGWLPSDSPDTAGRVIRAFPALTQEDAATAARMLVGALRSYGVAFEDLWHQVISPNVHLLGIGLPSRSGRR